MSKIKSIAHNLKLIFSREISEYLGEVETRAAARADAYEQAVDSRIEERLSAVDSRLNDYSSSLDNRVEERFAALDARINEQFDGIKLRIDERLDAIERRISDRSSELERRMDERADKYEAALDARIDERLGSVETRLDQRFEERARSVDGRLDDRFGKMERHVDERFNAIGKNIDDRMERHERKIDAMIRQMSNDIVERNDIMLQLFEQRLDRQRRELRELATPSRPAGADAGPGDVAAESEEDFSTNGNSPQHQLISFRKLADVATNVKTKVRSEGETALYHQILAWKKIAHEGLNNFTPDEQETVDYILSFLDDPKEVSYVQQHMRRFVATLQRIPPARRSGDRLLELGSLSHLAPAIRKYCGYKEVHCADFWQSDEKISRRSVKQKNGPDSYTFELRNFNVERDPFPYPDRHFYVALCCELIEHLQSDPMHMLWECNRVLEDDGFLLLTTPNIASCRAIEGLLVGCAPYLLAQYNVRETVDQHNREYAPYEIGVALAAAGFTVVELETEDVWLRSNPAILELLKQVQITTELRKDNIFALARKTGQPIERYPRELYID